MQKFKIRVQGENFLLKLKNGTKKRGFFATRFVEAPDEATAEQFVLHRIRKELGTAVLNAPSDDPAIHVDEINVLDSFDSEDHPGTGFVFYVEEDDELPPGPAGWVRGAIRRLGLEKVRASPTEMTKDEDKTQ